MIQTRRRQATKVKRCGVALQSTAFGVHMYVCMWHNKQTNARVATAHFYQLSNCSFLPSNICKRRVIADCWPVIRISGRIPGEQQVLKLSNVSV